MGERNRKLIRMIKEGKHIAYVARFMGMTVEQVEEFLKRHKYTDAVKRDNNSA